MILACSHIKKQFHDETLFSDVTFHINRGERTALVGSNGTGKTTLLKIIVGEQTAEKPPSPKTQPSGIFPSSRGTIQTTRFTTNFFR